MSKLLKTQSIEILHSFIGEWEVQAYRDGKPMGKDHITFEWIENGTFLRQTAETVSTEGVPSEWVNVLPTPLTCIIGFDDTNSHFSQLYADARGVFRVYQMGLDGRKWKLWREAPGFSQRFTGIFSGDGKKINGAWETSEDGKSWSKDFDLEYNRIEKR